MSRVKVLMCEWAFALLPSAPAPDREKRDSQAIIDMLRDTLEERNATVESLQNALNKAEMLCSTLKVSPQSRWEPEPQPQPRLVQNTVIYPPLPPRCRIKGMHRHAQPRLTFLIVSSIPASTNVFVYVVKVRTAHLFFPYYTHLAHKNRGYKGRACGFCIR